MKIKVLKGTKQIGGCISEVSTKNAKIIIDFGQDLDNEQEKKKNDVNIEGLTCGKSQYNAVFITHSHGDHIGLVNQINEDIAVYIEEKTFQIYEITCDFTNREKIKRKVNIFKLDETPIEVHDMLVTPYLTDHSSYHSCMFLIESEGKKILHTGDFRNHGRVGTLLKKTLDKIGEVDGLIIEGTTLYRNRETPLTEFSLEKKARILFDVWEEGELLGYPLLSQE